MATIIAGRFEQQSQVQQVISELVRSGFDRDQVSSFYVTPAGQHGNFPLGGDEHKSPGMDHDTTGVGAGWAAGGAVGAAIGAATTPLTGPLGAVTGAFVGAHIAAVGGALSQADDDGEDEAHGQPHIRHAGMMVAVSVPEGGDTGKAIEALRAIGAADIERREGTIVNGDWVDFDPVAPPSLIEGLSSAHRSY